MTLNEPLDRNSVAVVSLNVRVTDTSAEPAQNGSGILMITIIDINDFSWTKESPLIAISVNEEKPVGSEVFRFTTIDKDSNMARYEISPRNQFFEVEKGSGRLIVQKICYFEEVEQKQIRFLYKYSELITLLESLPTDAALAA